MKTKILLTLDIDWASEAVIDETLDFFKRKNIPLTVFSTHDSPILKEYMNTIDVGLHPFFDPHSSHGSTIAEVVSNILQIPHNLPAFRCHRFASCNTSREALLQAGMKISSNVCTDLETIAPFRDRFGIVEVPIFFEDGSYLYRKHPLTMHSFLENALLRKGLKVFLLHPMHFCLNTPDFNYMVKIKKSLTREEWNKMNSQTINSLRSERRGIRDLFIEILAKFPLESFIKLSHLTF